MKLYKVLFENNTPVSAKRLDVAGNTERISIVERNDGKFIEWLVVDSDSEADAITAAAEVIEGYKDAFLS